jgi:ribosomal protein L37AE/L43A
MLNPNEQKLDAKDTLICPSCGSPLTNFAGVTPGHSQVVRKGQIWLCAHCSNASIVGDSNLDNLTKEKFDSLPPHVRQAIGEVVTTLRDTTVKTTDLN